ncbi:MAG: hypothetical protein JO337_08940 [Acidimicrobiales bacterium]|nr:hypothetical protein [Acidimicrobiales bacterium]
MAANLRLVREGFGLELRRGTFHVLLDGSEVGTIEWRETVEVPLDPGHHTLQLGAGRYTSRLSSFHAAEGEMVNFRCNGARIWPVYLASIFKPDLAITLKRT